MPDILAVSSLDLLLRLLLLLLLLPVLCRTCSTATCRTAAFCLCLPNVPPDHSIYFCGSLGYNWSLWHAVVDRAGHQRKARNCCTYQAAPIILGPVVPALAVYVCVGWWCGVAASHSWSLYSRGEGAPSMCFPVYVCSPKEWAVPIFEGNRDNQACRKDRFWHDAGE